MPSSLLPLHIFEPRYRAMLDHCLQTHRLLAIATLDPDQDPDEQGRPYVHPELGIGEICRHQPLPDGRSHILLRHVATAALHTELDVNTPFRRVQASQRPPLEGYAPSSELRDLARHVAALAGPLGSRAKLFELEGDLWVDAMANLFLADERARRQYLFARDGDRRRQLVEAALVSRIHTFSPTAEA
jgi:Lon protease-like protein